MLTTVPFTVNARFADSSLIPSSLCRNHQKRTQMGRYFNVIPSEGNTACILLYGDIGDSWDGCDAKSVTMELMELQQTYDRIDFRINSYGGEVYAGLAIFNALQASTADIHIYVDGVAASMAAVIALCGKPLQMSRYASLMLHSTSTYAQGNKTELAEIISQLESLDKTLASIVAPRLGMELEAVLAKYFDGKDHWIDALQAHKSGLVDELYDIEEIGARASSSHHSVYMACNRRLRASKPTNQSINNKQMNKVMVTALAGIAAFSSCTDDEAVKAKIQALVAQAEEAEALKQEVDKLQQQVANYEKQEQEREDAKIKETLDEAEADGLIGKDDRTDVEALLRSNLEAAHKMLDRMRAKAGKRVMDYLSDRDNPPIGGLTSWHERMSAIQGK